MTYIGVKVGRGTKVHAGLAYEKRPSPLCLLGAGYYSPVRNATAITCERCLAAITKRESFQPREDVTA